MQIQTYRGTDPARSFNPEWRGVNVLGAEPFAVAEMDRGEQLQGREHIWHVLQARQCRLDFCPELAVYSIGGGQSETCNPARVIIQKEMDQLVRKVTQHGQLGEQGGLGKSASSSPSEVLHCQCQVPFFCQLDACPSLDEGQGNGTCRLRPRPDAAPKTICHAACMFPQSFCRHSGPQVELPTECRRSQRNQMTRPDGSQAPCGGVCASEGLEKGRVGYNQNRYILILRDSCGIHADTYIYMHFTALIQCLCHALARSLLQLGLHDAHTGSGRIAIGTVALSLHALVPHFSNLTGDILGPVE
jgi:hypothetical protein